MLNINQPAIKNKINIFNNFLINKFTTRSIKGMYYLYVKTHKATGIKYLGQTSRNPYQYNGSGKRWTNIIRKYGNDVETEIIFESNNKEELKTKGIYYSQLWNVVKDPKWANIINEEGTGGDTSNSPNYKKSLSNRDMSHKSNKDYQSKVSDSVKKAWQEKFKSDNFDNDAYKKMCSERTTNMWKTRGISDEDRKKRSTTWLSYIKENPEVIDKISASVKKLWQEKSKLYEVKFPDGHIEQVKCFRGWCKDNNLPYTKLYNTMRYNKPSKDGWMVKIID